MKLFITGISKGIGRSLAQLLIEEGHEVWGVARSTIDISHARLHHSVCDIRIESDIERVVAEMMRAKFYPEAVILNAGIEKPDLEKGFSYQTGKEIFATNYFGAMKWVDLFLRFPEKPKQFLAISSIFALRPNDQSISYSASKAALAMAFRSMRLQFLNSGPLFKLVYLVAVNTVVKPAYQAYFTGEKKLPFFVISPERAARFIANALSRTGPNFYSPLWISLLIRLTQWLPDRMFKAVTDPFRR